MNPHALTELILQKCHPRLLGMVAAFVVAVFGCFACYQGLTTPESTIDVRYELFQIAFHTGAVGLVIIALGIVLAIAVLQSQPEGRRSIRPSQSSAGTVLEVNGIQHMRDSLGQVLATIVPKGPYIALGNDNTPVVKNEQTTCLSDSNL